ncbi:MAG TPA: four helix bundle protein [Vicinamibacterales bacterium]|nr:four helix bundle protein [Vicinamibacterales bacterium]
MPPFEIRQRTFEFACAIGKFYAYSTDKTTVPHRVAGQLLDAGTAPGAILEEAEAAHSHADFVAKISTALKEARETHYWLRVIQASVAVPAERIEPRLREAGELIAILTAIRKNAGHRAGQNA